MGSWFAVPPVWLWVQGPGAALVPGLAGALTFSHATCQAPVPRVLGRWWPLPVTSGRQHRQLSGDGGMSCLGHLDTHCSQDAGLLLRSAVWAHLPVTMHGWPETLSQIPWGSFHGMAGGGRLMQGATQKGRDPETRACVLFSKMRGISLENWLQEAGGERKNRTERDGPSMRQGPWEAGRESVRSPAGDGPWGEGGTRQGRDGPGQMWGELLPAGGLWSADTKGGRSSEFSGGGTFPEVIT